LKVQKNFTTLIFQRGSSRPPGRFENMDSLRAKKPRARPRKSSSRHGSGTSPGDGRGHDRTFPLLVIAENENFASILNEIVSQKGLDAHNVPLSGFSPEKLRRNKSAAVVHCRSYHGLARKVVSSLRDMHSDLPILVIVDGGPETGEQKERFYRSGATLCISESAGREAISESIGLLIRFAGNLGRMAWLEESLKDRNLELASLRRDMDASQFQLAKRVQEQITVYRAARAMLSVFDFDDLANEIVRLATIELEAEVGSLMLIEGEDLVVRALYGEVPGEDPIMGRKQKVGEGISGWVAREGKPILIRDIEQHERFKERGGVRYKTKSCVSCPIIARGRIRGVINITNKKNGEYFTEEDLRLLRTMGMTAAIALDNFELVEQIRRSETMSSIGELATRMAHEIRNPLHAIKMNIQILAKKFPMDEDDREYYDILLGEIDRLENIVKEVLTFARQEKLNLAPCDLRKLIDKMLAMFKNLFDEKNVELEYEPAPDMPLIYVDEAKIEQVLMNLIVNALEAMPDGGKISITMGVVTPFVYPRSHYGEEFYDAPGDQNRYAVITVADNGPGIDREHWDKIFNPFFTTKTDGTGLGLSTTRKNIEAHGGKISFDTEKNIGTTFKIELPIIEDTYRNDLSGDPCRKHEEIR